MQQSSKWNEKTSSLRPPLCSRDIATNNHNSTCKSSALLRFCFLFQFFFNQRTSNREMQRITKQPSLQRITKQPSLTSISQKRCLMLFSHLVRMDESADARILTAVPQSEWKSLTWRPHTSWLATMKNNLSSYNLVLNLSVLWHCWLGDSTSIRPVKTLLQQSQKFSFVDKWLIFSWSNWKNREQLNKSWQ